MVRNRRVAAAAVSVLVVTGLVVAAVVAPSAPGAANPVVHWATGAGHQDDVDAATGEVFNRTFSFSAVRYADGTAEGNAQIASRKFQQDGKELVIHMSIDCLSVLPDGKTARIFDKLIVREKGCAGGGTVWCGMRHKIGSVSQHILETTQESHGSSLGFGTVLDDGSR